MICKLIRFVMMGMIILTGFSLVATDDKVVVPVGLVRSACLAPRGVNRFGFGCFREFQFGEKYVPLDGDVPLKRPETNGELLVERKLENPWCGFVKALLCYAKGNGLLYKIEQVKTFEGENSAKDANKCVQEVLQVCSRGFNSVFQKVVTASSTTKDQDGFSCVYVYDNQDGEFPIKISVLRKDNVRRVLLSIESARVANERLGRKNTSYVAEKTNETKVVEIRKSPVSFLPMRGHPRKVSLLMALVELSGVDVTNRIPDKVVRYQFEKSVGPFTSVVVKMDNVAKPLFAGLEPFKGGGMATQVVSCVTRQEPTFETAVRRVRDVKTALARESRIYNFVDRTEEGSCYDVRTASPTLGGWMVFISVRRVATDDYEYKMLLERNLRTDSQTRDISVEVEL